MFNYVRLNIIIDKTLHDDDDDDDDDDEGVVVLIPIFGWRKSSLFTSAVAPPRCGSPVLVGFQPTSLQRSGRHENDLVTLATSYEVG